MAASVPLIEEYFPHLSSKQLEQFAALGGLYAEWNEKINVISRKDIENLYERHVLHSLAIAHFYSFLPKATVLDVGTGGGFPGIPLAIIYPETQFTCIDAIGKKVNVVNEIATALGLTYVVGEHVRVEHIKKQFDFIVSRAVTALPKFCMLAKGKIKKVSHHGFANGIIYLKGGDFADELKQLRLKGKPTVHSLKEVFPTEFFETKAVVHLPL